MASPAYSTGTSVAGGFTSGANNVSVPASGSNAANDVMVMVVYKETLGATVTSTNFVKPSDGSAGFDEVANSNHSIYVGYKRLTANDTGNYSVNVGGDNSWTEFSCSKITGCVTSGSPWDDIDSATSGGSVTAAPTVASTTTVVDTLLFYVATNFTGGAWTVASGMTERYDASGNTTVDTLAQAATGGSGNKSATCAGSGRSISWMGALKPASTSTSANAENAAATGAANAATIAIGVNAENAAGTGTAYDATVSTSSGTNASAEVAAATGTAYDATVAIGVSAGSAAATGTAYDAETSAPPPFTFPATLLGLIAEIAPGADPADDPDDWPWLDISERVLLRGALTAVTITRGATSATGQAPVARAVFQLNNLNGLFSTQNYNSPYVQAGLVRGTPIRFRIDDGPIDSTRFVGRMDALPPRWDLSGRDRWVPVTASGIQRRLGVGVRTGQPTSGTTVPPPVVSASRAATDIVASWPCTDTSGSSADEVAVNGPELGRNSSSALVWAQVTGPDGVSLLPSFENGGILSGAVEAYASSTEWTAETVAQIDDRSPLTVLQPLTVDTNGTGVQWAIRVNDDGSVSVVWEDPGGTVATACSAVWPARDGAFHTWSMRCAQDGSDVDVDLRVDGTSIATGTVSSATCGTAVEYFRLGDGQADGGIVSMGYGRLFRSSTPTTTTIEQAVEGFTSETASERFERLCLGQGVPYELFGTSAQLMGPQSDANFLAQLRECEAVDAGLLAESRGGRMAFYARELKENATSALTLDMSAAQVADLESDDSDAGVVNSQTVTLTSDSSATATVTDDVHAEIYQPYEGSPQSINAASASQLAPHAGLAVWLGTYTGLRYPSLTIDLRRIASMAATVADLDFHDRVTITNPSEPPNETIDMLLIGCVEELGSKMWRQTWTTVPYAPWEIPGAAGTPATDDGTGWLVPDTFVLAEDLDASETAVDVTASPVLPTAAAHYPVRLRIGVEEMTATACSGAGPTQTLTVTRGTGGATTTHANGDAVEILDALVAVL